MYVIRRFASAAAAAVSHGVLDRPKGRANNLRRVFVKHELRKSIQAMPVVGVIQYGDLSSAEMNGIRSELAARSLRLKIAPRRIAAAALEGDPEQERMAQAFKGKLALIFANKLEYDALKKLDAHPKMVKVELLLGAMTDGQFLSRLDLEYLATLPDIQTLRGQLVSILQQQPMRLVQTLTASQTKLVMALQQYVDAEEKKTNQPPAAGAEPAPSSAAPAEPPKAG